MTYTPAAHEPRSHRGAGRMIRTANSTEHQARLATRLTERDRWLIRMLHEHRVLTSPQIQVMAFPSARAANARLLELYQWRVLDRFQPFRALGSAPMHYVLDTAGATVLAGQAGLDPTQLGYRHDRAVGVAHNLRLPHTLGLNDIFTTLVAIAHTSGENATARALVTWWGEHRCARLVGDLVRPDAYALWREDHRQLGFYLEYDTGSKNLTQLAAKLEDYHALAATTGTHVPVLFWLPTSRRETTARHALAIALTRLEDPDLIRVATTAADLTPRPTPDTSPSTTSPAAARWLPVNTPTHNAPVGRVRLAALADRWPSYQPPDTHAAISDHTGTRARPLLEPPCPMPPRPMPPRPEQQPRRRDRGYDAA